MTFGTLEYQIAHIDGDRGTLAYISPNVPTAVSFATQGQIRLFPEGKHVRMFPTVASRVFPIT